MSNTYKLIHGIAVNDLPNLSETPAYKCWNSMIGRVYSEAEKDRCPTYQDCSIHEEWLRFSNFYEFYSEHHFDGSELDKDIYGFGPPPVSTDDGISDLGHKWHFKKPEIGRRTYGPDTCIFVSRFLNNQTYAKEKRVFKKNGLPRGVRQTESGNYEGYIKLLGEKKQISLGRNHFPEEAELDVLSHQIENLRRLVLWCVQEPNSAKVKSSHPARLTLGLLSHIDILETQWAEVEEEIQDKYDDALDLGPIVSRKRWGKG